MLSRVLRGGSRGLRVAQRRSESTLVLMRHGESEWNKSNRFTGWYDVALSEKGHEEAKAGGLLIKDEQIRFDKAYTSYLRRAIRTCWHALEHSEQFHVPITTAWQLNERHYGALTGLNKQETKEKHGEVQVNLWRRSYDIPPPALDASSEHFPGNDPKYQNVDPASLPFTESLKITAERVLPYWEDVIVPDLKAGNTLLVAAHGNSLRALVMHLDSISEEDITELNIPTGVPLVYKLDDNMKPIKSDLAIEPLQGRYLGDQEAVRERILGVKNQTK